MYAYEKNKIKKKLREQWKMQFFFFPLPERSWISGPEPHISFDDGKTDEEE